MPMFYWVLLIICKFFSNLYNSVYLYMIDIIKLAIISFIFYRNIIQNKIEIKKISIRSFFNLFSS